MPGKTTRPSTSKRALKAPSSDGDHRDIRNQILLALPRNEYQVVVPQLEFVRLKPRHLLHEAGDTLKSAYFCNTGMISILSVLSDGKCVEVGLVGKEGLVGLPLVAGFRAASTRAIVQIEATAFRVSADALTEMLRTCPVLERRLQQASQISAMEVTQIAACNRLHEVEKRLTRWLLMCADRIDSNSLPLTQELLGQMLGTRRSSVTVAAGVLAKDGLISSARGYVTIKDRQRLKQVSCECYELMQNQIKLWRDDRA
ncbi:MAG: Crp/Fnr family transcriptional regulator [Candidatus Sulfotelmatobacter sp.]